MKSTPNRKHPFLRRRTAAYVLLLCTVGLGGTPVTAQAPSSCYVDASTSRGAEIFLDQSVDPTDSKLVGCVFPNSVHQNKGSATCGDWGIIPTEGGSCYACFDDHPVGAFGEPPDGQAEDGSWGLFRTKFKSWRPSADLSCLSRDLADYHADFPPSFHVQCAGPPDFIVGLWKFDEVTARESVSDMPVKVQGSPKLAAGRIDYALEFDGDYLEIPDLGVSFGEDIGTNDFSLATWVKTRQKNGIATIVDKRVKTGSNYHGWHLFLYNGKPGLQLADGKWHNYVAKGEVAEVADGAWHHIVVSVDRNAQISWYVDGESAGQFPHAVAHQGSLSNAAPLWIGRHSFSPPYFFKGRLDELMLVMYDALDVAAVEEIYHASAMGICF